MGIKLVSIVQVLRWSGLGQVWRILNYTRRRSQLDRKYRLALEAQPAGPALPPGSLDETASLPNGAQFTFQNAGLELVFLAPDLVRLSWEPGEAPLPYALARTEWPETPVRLEHTPQGVRLESSELRVVVGAQGSLHFSDLAGRLLRVELPPLHAQAAYGPAWTSQALLRPDECLYGLGEQTGPLNLRGSTHRMWNTDPGGAYSAGEDPIYMPLPVYLGLHGRGSYLVFYENYYPASFQFAALDQAAAETGAENPAGPENLATCAFEGGMLRQYFIAGPPARLLERYSELTGRPDLPPRWSLGYHQSRWGYSTQSEIRELVRGFQAHQMPLGAVHLDIDYMDGYRVFTVDPQRFPDLGKLAGELAGQEIRLVAIVDPGVKQDPAYRVYQEGLAEGAFCSGADGQTFTGVVWPGASVFPDFTDPQTRDWWARQYAFLVELGIAGAWHDMNEPATFAVSNGSGLALETRHALEGRGGDHRQAHNLYGLQMARAGYAGLRQAAPERRPWMITRSGWAGIQRYAWNWSGDSETSWESLRMTVALITGSGLSGQPFNGPDIGGFSGSPPAELYLRWLQAAAFMPFFRTHSAIGTARREPWVFGEPYTRIIRDFLRLRYRLLPYLYSLAWEASQRGLPLVRPLWWADPLDQALWPVEDAFLLGEALLVAPMLQAGETRRKLRLPTGDWYDLWDGSLLRGPGEVEVRAGLERIPVLARGGRLLPMDEGDRLALHLYALPDSFRQGPAGQLYSDAGDGYGDWRLDSFTWQRKGRSLELAWQSQGAFPFPHRQVELHLHGWQAPQAWIDEQAALLRDGRILTSPFQILRLENL